MNKTSLEKVNVIPLEMAVTQIKQACEYVMANPTVTTSPTAEQARQEEAQKAPPQGSSAGAAGGESAAATSTAIPPQTGSVPSTNGATINGGRRPFFFLVGAGISCPTVPLSTKIVEECKTFAKKFDLIDEPTADQAMDVYSYWFDRAYPHPKQRQIFLRSLIEEKSISAANFRLAHLLLSKKVANLVVTPNFDDFISRALTLFGEPHIVCDHPAAVERINPEQDDIQILHVHGTYWFYDCVNLRSEIASRAQTSASTNATMAYKIDDVLERSSPLVIGYSGWEEDVVMQALKRRLHTTLPYKLYWFCYHEDEIKSLPDWLVHPQVCFVTRQGKPLDADGTSAGNNRAAQPTESSLLTKIKETDDKQDDKNTLTAQVVLETLNQKLEVERPHLTEDPFGFFAQQLKNSLPKDSFGNVEDHTYSLRGIIEEAQELSKKLRSVNPQLKKALDALRSSQNREAIVEAGKINLMALNETQLRDLMDAMWSAASGLNVDSKEKVEGFDLVVAVGDLLIKPDTVDPSLRVRVAKALCSKGAAFDELKRSAEAVAMYEEVVTRYGDTSDPLLAQWVAKALNTKVTALIKLERLDDALEAADQVVARFDESSDPVLNMAVAKALTNKTYVLSQLKRGDEALEICNRMLERFGSSTIPEMFLYIALELRNKGAILYNMRRDEAIAAYEELVKRFGEEKDPAIVEQVAVALNSIGFELLCRAKLEFKNNNPMVAQEYLTKSLEKITASLERRPENVLTLGNQGYLAFLSGRKDEARTILARAIKLGGEAIREIEIGDSRVYELPQDEEFRELLRSISEFDMKAT